MFQELSDGVFRRRYESLDLNIGVVMGEDGLLIVDTRASHRQADVLRQELRSISQLPVRWVVNTHWHWDHSFGNSRFPDAEIWGHEACRRALLDRGDEMKAGAKDWLPDHYHPVIDEVEIRPPDKTFSDRVSIDIGRDVELGYHGLGHTDADIVITVPDAGVSFMGDLVEESAPPNFGDSYPLTWPLTLRLAMENAANVVVPGHGDVVDKSFVRSQHEELVVVAEAAARVIEGEFDIDSGISRGPYSPDVMRSAVERALAVSVEQTG